MIATVASRGCYEPFGVAERFVRTIRSECLDWLLILDQDHLERVRLSLITITAIAPAACWTWYDRSGHSQ
jgi:hypothetical protein